MYKVNVLVLDDQHQHILDNIELLEQAMRSGVGAATAPRILASLSNFAGYHFPTEERLMQTYSYPLRDTHAVEHEKARITLRRLEQAVRDDDNMVAIDLLAMLRNWLDLHVGDWDKPLGAYLNDRGVT